MFEVEKHFEGTLGRSQRLKRRVDKSLGFAFYQRDILVESLLHQFPLLSVFNVEHVKWRLKSSKKTRVSVLLIKGKGFPYSLPSVGPGADSGVQAVSPQVTISHPPGGRLPLLSARPGVTFPAAEHNRPLARPSYTAW